MSFNLSQWIDTVREKPEHVRRRYVFVCVAASMFLVIGIWLLSVTESFQTVSKEGEGAAENSRDLLPKASNFSLDELLKNKEGLGSEKKDVSGNDYYNTQANQQKQPDFNEQDEVAPVDPVSPDTGTTAGENK